MYWLRPDVTVALPYYWEWYALIYCYASSVSPGSYGCNRIFDHRRIADVLRMIVTAATFWLHLGPSATGMLTWIRVEMLIMSLCSSFGNLRLTQCTGTSTCIIILKRRNLWLVTALVVHVRGILDSYSSESFHKIYQGVCLLVIKIRDCLCWSYIWHKFSWNRSRYLHVHVACSHGIMPWVLVLVLSFR